MKDETGTIIGMHPTRRQDSAQGYEQDEGIDLREYIALVIQRKNIVLAVWVVSVLLAAVWIFSAPKLYEVSVLIGPPSMVVTDAGAQEFDSVLNMKAQIDAGVFNERIAAGVGVDPSALKFIVSQPKESRIMKVSVNQSADKADLGKKILTELIEALNSSYAKFIEDKRFRIENQIKLIRGEIARKESEIVLKNGQFKLMTDREQQCLENLTEAKVLSEKFSSDRARIADKNESKEAGASMLYVATIQQNINYLSQIKNELSDARFQKETILNRTESLKNGINDDRISIENLKLGMDSMHNIVIFQRPLVASKPVGAGKARNLMVAASAAGLIAGLLSAFLVEYWKSFVA